MSTPLTPKLIKGGLVVVDPESGAVRRVIAFQYNSDALTRTLQVQGVDGDGGTRSEALRLKGAAIETIKVEVEIDATDRLEKPKESQSKEAVEVGIHPQLAVLESLVNPTAAELIAADALASIGTIEILPVQRPLVLFVWSRRRVVPVRVTEFSITEEAFDTALNPIRAKVSLGLRVLTADDLGYDHKGGALHLGYLLGREALAQRAPLDELGQLGLGAPP